MNKREIDITELMDSYTDNEFNIMGEAGVDAENIVSTVLPQVKQKKKVKPLFKVLIAAAAAVVLAGAATAAGFIGKGVFTTATNLEFGYDVGEHYTFISIDLTNAVPPVKLEDGRLYFTLDGMHKDITELVDRTTPFIYSYTNPETNRPIHIIVGGDPDKYAFVELMKVDELGWQGIGAVLEEEHCSWSCHADVGIIPPTTFENGWYLTDESVRLDMTWSEDLNGDGELQDEEVFYHAHEGISFIPETWKDDCMDAWLISAMLELDLFELPDYSLINPIEQTEDGRLIFVAEGQHTDITDLINDETPYIYFTQQGARFGGQYESCIIAGGTPDNYGWTLLCRHENNRGINEWIGVEENISYKAEPDGADKYRDWYLNGVNEIGYNQGQLHMTRGAVRSGYSHAIGTRV